MAYARFGEEGSEVYVYRSIMPRSTKTDVTWICCHMQREDGEFDSLRDLLKHLENDHIGNGELVPMSCINRIRREMDGEDPDAYGKELAHYALRRAALHLVKEGEDE